MAKILYSCRVTARPSRPRQAPGPGGPLRAGRLAARSHVTVTVTVWQAAAEFKFTESLSWRRRGWPR